MEKDKSFYIQLQFEFNYLATSNINEKWESNLPITNNTNRIKNGTDQTIFLDPFFKFFSETISFGNKYFQI